jgi:hypothetical protein
MKKAKVSKYGQWKYPGEDTIIPNANGSITMKGVPYPVLGIDDQGNRKLMMPGMDYQFPGNSVYEIPMMAAGGIVNPCPPGKVPDGKGNCVDDLTTPPIPSSSLYPYYTDQLAKAKANPKITNPDALVGQMIRCKRDGSCKTGEEWKEEEKITKVPPEPGPKEHYTIKDSGNPGHSYLWKYTDDGNSGYNQALIGSVFNRDFLNDEQQVQFDAPGGGTAVVNYDPNIHKVYSDTRDVWQTIEDERGVKQNAQNNLNRAQQQIEQEKAYREQWEKQQREKQNKRIAPPKDIAIPPGGFAMGGELDHGKVAGRSRTKANNNNYVLNQTFYEDGFIDNNSRRTLKGFITGAPKPGEPGTPAKLAMGGAKKVKIKSLPKAQSTGDPEETPEEKSRLKQVWEKFDISSPEGLKKKNAWDNYNASTEQWWDALKREQQNLGRDLTDKEKEKWIQDQARGSSKVMRGFKYNRDKDQRFDFLFNPEQYYDPGSGNMGFKMNTLVIPADWTPEELKINEYKKEFLADLNADPLQKALGQDASFKNPNTLAAATRYARYKVLGEQPGNKLDRWFRGNRAPSMRDFYEPTTISGAADFAGLLTAGAAASGGLAALGAGAFMVAPEIISATGAALNASPAAIPGLSIGNTLAAADIAYVGKEALDPNSDTRRSIDVAIDNPNTENILGAIGQVGLTGLDLLGANLFKGGRELVQDAYRGVTAPFKTPSPSVLYPDLQMAGFSPAKLMGKVNEAETFNVNSTEAFIRNAQKEGIIPAGANVQTLVDNPNLLNTVVTRGIKNNLTVGRRVTPSAGAGVAESSMGTITDLAKGDAEALARFTGDPIGEAFHMGTHVPRTTYGQRSGLSDLPKGTDALYFDAPGNFAKQERVLPNQYGDFTVTSRIPFEYSSDPQSMYAKYMRMLQETKGMSGGKGAQPGDIFGRLHGSGAEESAIIGRPGQQVLEPVSVSTISEYNKPLEEFDELLKLSKEDPEKFKAAFWEKYNSGQIARTKQEAGLSDNQMFIEPLYGDVKNNPTINDLKFALRADAQNKQFALKGAAPIQKTNFSPLTTNFGNSAPVQLTGSQANRRLATAQKQFDVLNKRGYENLTPNELYNVFTLEHEIKTLGKEVNKTTGGVIKQVRIKSLPKAQITGELKEQALQRDWNRQQATAWDPNQLNGAQEIPTDTPVAVRPMTIGLPPKDAPKKSKEETANDAAKKTNKKAQNDATLWLLDHPEYMLDADGNPVLKSSMEANAPAEYLTEQQKALKEEFIRERNAEPLQQTLGTLGNNPQTAGAAERYANTELAAPLLEKNPRDKYNTRAEWLESFNPQERAIIQASNKSYKFNPNVWTTFARALQTEGNRDSQWQRNLDLTQEEKNRPVTKMDRLGLLAPLVIPAYGAQRLLTGDYENLSDIGSGDTPKPYFGDSGTMRDYYQPEAQAIGNGLWQAALDPLNYIGVGGGNLLGDARVFNVLDGPISKSINEFSALTPNLKAFAREAEDLRNIQDMFELHQRYGVMGNGVLPSNQDDIFRYLAESENGVDRSYLMSLPDDVYGRQQIIGADLRDPNYRVDQNLLRGWLAEDARINNRVMPPPSEITFDNANGFAQTYANPFNQQEIIDLTRRSGSSAAPSLRERLMAQLLSLRRSSSQGTIDLRRPQNFVSAWDTPEVPKNRSQFTKEDAKAFLKDKSELDKLEKLDDQDFRNILLTPDGKIKFVQDQKAGKSEMFAMETDEYVKDFNDNIDLLNNIIRRNNESGRDYMVTGLTKVNDKKGLLHFRTPEGRVSSMNVGITPGRFRGDVKDIADEYYMTGSVPGLQMEGASPIFGVAVPKTRTYQSLNEFLKTLDMGRIKSGMNMQSDFSRGLWEDAVKKGNAFGYYSSPRVVHGIMKKEGGVKKKQPGFQVLTDANGKYVFVKT